MTTKDEEYQKVYNKLVHKMPVTFRWGLLSGFLLGCVHAMVAKKSYYMATHTIGFGLGAGLGLCYNDFNRVWNIYQSKDLK